MTEREFLRAKIHRATVTGTNPEYEGSVTVAADLLSAADIAPFERVQVVNVTTGTRLETYAIEGPPVLIAPTWFVEPLTRSSLFGAPGTVHLLVLGIIGFVVLGTLYHIVPFIIWVHRYSDLLGYEKVPMIDDLYNSRIAAVDFVAVLLGTGVLILTEWFALSRIVFAAGGLSVLAGFCLFVVNMLLVIRTHSPHGLRGILVSRFAASKQHRRVS